MLIYSDLVRVVQKCVVLLGGQLKAEDEKKVRSRMMRPRHVMQLQAMCRRQKSDLSSRATVPVKPSIYSEKVYVGHNMTLEYSPPDTAPSYRDTPTCFLPQHLQQQSSTSTIQPHSLPPALSERRPKQYNLTPTDIEEIRRLRLADPRRNSALRLSKQFKCSPLVIRMIQPAPKEHKVQMQRELDAQKAVWGLRKVRARADRVKRRALWDDEYVLKR